MKPMLLGLGLLLAGAGVACADDTALDAAFKAALKSTPDAAALKADQADWAANLDLDCAYDESGDPETPEGTAACLADETAARIRYLTGAPLEGPGAPEPMVPVALPGADGTFGHATRFADPHGAGEKTFNALLESYLKDMTFAATEDDVSDYFEQTITYASPKLVSASIELAYLGDQYVHPMPYDFGINVDLTTGRSLTISDLVDDKRLPALMAACEKQTQDFISPDESGADVRKGKIDTIVGNLDFWSFGATAATLRYIDSDLEGPAECVLDYGVLRPIAKSGFPLPQ